MMQPSPDRRRHPEAGFALLFVYAMAATVAIMLLMQLPAVSFEAQRDREQLLIDRGEQYSRAVQIYVRKFNSYPPDMDKLENTNGQHFLRHRYTDPLTGKDEWRLIHVGPGGVFTDSLVYNKKTTDPASGGKQNFITEIPTVAPDQGTAGGVNLATRRQNNANGPFGAGQGTSYPSPNQGDNPTAGMPPMPSSPLPGQSFPGQGAAGQSFPAQGFPGQSFPGQGFPGQGFPGQGFPGQNQGLPGQNTQPAQPAQSNLSGSIGVFPGLGGSTPTAGTLPPGQGIPGQSGQGLSPNQLQNIPGGLPPGVQFPPGVQPPTGIQQGVQLPGQPGAVPGGAAANMINQLLTTPRQMPGVDQFGNPLPQNNPQNGQQNGQLFGQQPGGAFGGSNPAGSAPGTPIAGQGMGQQIGGGIAGVASKVEQKGIKTYRERDKYNEWEFVYDITKDKSRAGGAQQAAPGAANPAANPSGFGATPPAPSPVGGIPAQPFMPPGMGQPQPPPPPPGAQPTQ